MFRGNLSSTSALAALAMSGMIASGANAADLGGNCCADLEERVAELEATTARKGNRKVSLQIYGQVSETLLFWNDGAEKNVYVAENQDSKNRIGFQGNAKINSDWSAGFKMELQIRAYRSSNDNQLALGASNNVSITTYNTQSVSLREAHWFLKSNTYGTITVGRVPEAGSGAGIINLANPDGFARNGYAAGRAHQGFFLRRSNSPGNAGLSSLTWNNAFHRNGSNTGDYEYRTNHSGVKYTSPFFLGQTKSSGFLFDTSWGHDDIWAVGLRYVEEFGAFRVAAGVSYSQTTASDYMFQCTNLNTAGGAATVSAIDCNLFQASGSIMHTPTGLYASGGYGQLEDKNRTRSANTAQSGLGSFIRDTDSSWWVQGGWVAKLNSFGSTTFWGQYASYSSYGNVANNTYSLLGAADVLNSFGNATSQIQKSDSSTWSLGVTQDVDAAAMKLYMGYINSSVDLTLINRANFQSRKSNSVDDIGLFFTGATIKF